GLNALARSLRRGQWPPASTATRKYDIDLQYAGAYLTILMLDYAGESFCDTFDKLSDEETGELAAYFANADVLLLFLDPRADLGLGAVPSQSYGERHDQRLTAMYNAIQRLAQADRRSGKRMDKAIGLLVTKADVVSASDRARGAGQIIKKALPKLHQTVKDSARDHACFFVSSIGGDHSDSPNPERPPKKIAPSGYHELFTWIARLKKGRDNRKSFDPIKRILLRRALPIAIVAVLALAALWWRDSHHLNIIQASWPSENEKAEASGRIWLRRADAQRIIDAELGGALVRIRSDIAEAIRPEDLRPIEERLETLSRYRNHNHGFEITEARKTVSTREEEMHIKRIDATSDLEERNRMIAEYMSRFPEGRFKDEAGRLRASNRAELEQRQRRVVARVMPGASAVSWVQFLAQKADAVDEYRLIHASPDRAAEMKRATELARFISNTRQYALTIHGAGTLNDNYYTQFIIRGRENAVLAQTTSLKDKTPSWDFTKMDFTWSPGDRIRLEWYKEGSIGSWRWGTIASLENTQFFSLRSLCGRQLLGEDEHKSYLAGGRPFVRLSIKGLEDNDWELLEEYIHPGRYWNQ
ncbi:MAG: hypothetical protein FWG74_01960, partial [Planctomycetes bacterium]|nr:hypothetical protein [Planctomycetota bacterium]